jgi:glyoxylase-like metal-dependent hydrolase (beta-lactamase superfamily II)
MMRFRLARTWMLAAALAGAGPLRAADPAGEIRLYALDCGYATAKDGGFLSDTGEYDGKPVAVAVPCFLIRHPKGTLLWDTGLSDKVAESQNGVENDGIHMSMARTLASQLKELGLSAGDVTYVAFSHLHFDHTSNANAFAASTWIMNGTDLKWALGTPTPFGVDPASFSAYSKAKNQMIEGDHDVFGDRTVRILKTPGHTPGHQVLLLQLRKSGTVILSGDLYHLRANRKFRRIPDFNSSRAETLASIDRIERIIKNRKARLVVQHDPLDFAGLPKFPAYLE